MTNHHVINFHPDEPIVGWELENAPAPLTFSLSSEKLQFREELKLEESSISYAFSCSRLDVTLLEFSQEEFDRFTAKEVVFLDMERDVSASYGDGLHIYGHPGGGQLCKGEGRLIGQPTPLICYSVDTDPGFSGSPIFKVIMVDRHENSFRYQLVGIHHRAGDKNKYNCGTPIETVIRAIDRDRPIALQERLYPIEQMDNAEEDILIQHLFEVDLNGAKDLDPPIDRVSVFNHPKPKYYAKPRFYKINSGNVEMTLSHSLLCDQFTLMDVLHSEHIAVPWRDFGVDEFKAFHKLAMGIQRVCSLERSEHTGTTILKSLEGHLQQMLDKVSLAEYYCRDGNEQRQINTIEKLKWAAMCKNGPEHLAYALVKTRGLELKEDLNAKLNHFKRKEVAEVELIETIAVCLTAITSQLRTIGRPPAHLKTHVQRTDAVDKLTTLIKQSFKEESEGPLNTMLTNEKTAAVSVWGMGGLGKTHLVLDVVQSATVQKQFPSLIWHEVGQLTDTTLEDNIKQLAENIGAASGNYMKNNIHNIMRKLQEPQFKDTLLVIDNVWSSDVAKNFLFDFPTVFTSRVRLAFDTDQRVAAYLVPNGFKRDETAELLSKCTQTTDIHERATEMSELHSLCGGHPLVVAILARNIARQIEQGYDGWDVVTNLKAAGLKTAVLPKSEPINEQRHRNVLPMLTAILDTMEVEDRNCLHALRICKRGAKITRKALQALWKEHIDDPDQEADYLCNQALLQEEQQNIFSIHDVIFDLIIRTETAVTDKNCHMRFIQNFERHICPLEQVPQQDAYMITHCGYHLLKANMKKEWVDLFVHNIDFLEAVAGQGIDLLHEFTLAERLFLEEEERLKEKDDSAQTIGPVLPHFAAPIFFASLYRRVKSKLRPRENTHVAFLTEVSQTLLKLIERHGNNTDSKKQETQEMVISQITRILSKALFTDFRNRQEVSTTTDSKLALYLRATEMAEKGLNLITSLRRQAEPAEIQRLVAEMQLPSFFQTVAHGGTCMHVAMIHEQPVAIFDILEKAKGWDQQSTVENQEMMYEVQKLKIAGSNALLKLYHNFEKQLYPHGTTEFLEVLQTFTIEPQNYILTDNVSSITNEQNRNTTKQSLMLAVMKSAVFQTHQFAIANSERWKKIQRTNDCHDDANYGTFGLWYIFSFVGIQPALRNNVASEHQNDLSWKGLINAQTSGGDTALHMACLNGHLQVVKKLLHHSADLLKETNKNVTCLQVAAGYGHQDVVDSLLSHLKEGADQYINNQDIEGGTALHLACQNGHLQVVNKLLDHSADLLKETNKNVTCLQVAAGNGHQDVVDSLLSHLKEGADQYINNQDIDGGTALHYACQNGHLQVVNQLLDHSANINHQNNNGATAFHVACQNGHLQVVKKLLHRSGDLLKETNKNVTCLQVAAGNGYQDVVDSLLSHLKEGADQYINNQDIDGGTALHYACQNGHLQVVKKLLHHSADLLKKTNKNVTCLQVAAVHGHQDVVDSLLSHLKEGADQYIKNQDIDGWTALHLACQNGHLQVVNKLLDHSANINHQDNNGMTALHVACQNGHLQVVKKLLHHSGDFLKETNKNFTCLQVAAGNGHQDAVDSQLSHLKEGNYQHINHQDINGGTALHYACQNGHLQVISQLLDHSANINHQDNNGGTALHVACHNGHLQVVKKLLHHSADLLKETNKNVTCLQVAAGCGHQDVVDSLLSHLKEGNHQHINHQDIDGVTALHYACKNGHLQVVNQLLHHSADLLKETNKNVTCLQVAAGHGHQDVVDSLLSHLKEGNYQHINHQDINGVTALYYACQNGHLQVVNQLLDHSANINHENNNGGTALYVACHNEHLQVVKKLLHHSADLLKKTNKNVTCLQVAAGYGHQDVVDSLLSHLKEGADQYINNQDIEGGTALHYACQNGHLQVVNQLLDHSANINHQDNNGATALHVACQNGHLQVVKKLLHHSADLLKKTNKNVTCLQVAAGYGHQDVVDSLLSHLKEGADQYINNQDIEGGTALHYACQNGHLQVVNQLLDHSANINHQDNNGATALYVACQNGHLQVVKKLLHHSADLLKETNKNVTCLQVAAAHGHQNIVESLLSHLKEGADQYINRQDINGATALHLACSEGHLEVVKKLLHHHSVDLLKETNINVTCLQVAAAHGHQNIVESLLSHLKEGANQHINHEDIDGETALYCACKNGHLEVANQLLDHCADLFIRDKKKMTCLHVAAGHGHQNVVESLLSHLKEGADQYINHQDINGATALYYACQNGHLQVVNKLLDHSANINHQDINGATALYLACQNGHLQIVNQLLNHSANINHQDSNGATALHYACQNGHLQIVNQLLNHSADLLKETNKNVACLQVAARNGHQDVVERLLIHLKEATDQDTESFDQYLNHQDIEGWTALHHACGNGHLQVVNHLLDHSADLFKEDKKDWTCLHLAAALLHQDVVERLLIHLKKGTEQNTHSLEQYINHQSNDGSTALHFACCSGHTETVDILLYYFADYLNADANGDTCLQNAVLKQQSTIVQQLLKHVSDKKTADELKLFIDHQNNKGETALHKACDRSSLEIVNILLSYLADPSLQDSTNGNTCLQNAISKKESAIINSIVQHVKDHKGLEAVDELLNQENKQGQTAIHMALSLEDTSVLELLMDY